MCLTAGQALLHHAHGLATDISSSALTPAGVAWMTRLASLQLLLSLTGDSLQPLLPLLQLPCLGSCHISDCQPSGGQLLQQLAAAQGLQELSIQVNSRLQPACRTQHNCFSVLAVLLVCGLGDPF
jgi:hypothetical protein